MSRSFAAFLALLLFPLLLPAQEVSLFDFRIRESQYHRTVFDLSGWYSRPSSSSNTFSNSQNNNYSFNGSVNHAQQSMDEDHRLSATVGFSGQKNSYNSSYTNSGSSNTSRQNAEGVNLSINLNGASYLQPDEWYLYGSINSNESYQLSRSFYEPVVGVPSSNYSKYTRLNQVVGVGAGYGKLRDARSVVLILRVLENLSQDGFLTRPLTAEEIIALAERYDAALTTDRKYDRETKHLLKLIFDDLLEKGLITPASALAYAAGRTTEVFSEQIYSRVVGWTVESGPGLDYSDTRYTTTTNQPAYSKTTANHWLVMAQYGRPLSLLLHSYSVVTVKLPVFGGQKRVGLSLNTTLTHEIGERSSASCSIGYNRDINHGMDATGGSFDGRTEYLSANAQYNYILEDALSFTAQANYSDQLGITERSNTKTRTSNGQYNFSFGLAYRLF